MKMKNRQIMLALLPDVVAVLGAVSLVYGASLAWHPAGYLVAGVLLIGVSVFSARKAK